MTNVNFNKKVYCSNKFRQRALDFERTGYYCLAPEGTTEYMSFWDKETERCLYGYTAEDGEFISGFNYFYLNYCPIKRIVEYEAKDKEGNIIKKHKHDIAFPSFYSYDSIFFDYIEDCQNQGKHAVVLKARRRGYSYKMASMLIRNYYLIPNSKGFVFASDKKYLTGDGIITKAWQYMDFIDKHTAWSKKRQAVDRELHRRASILTTDSFGNKIEEGYKSEIIGTSLKSDPDKLRGISGQLIFFEESGSFPELAAAWAIARPSVEQDSYVTGLLCAWGTASADNTSFRALKDMFTNPEGYNVLGVPNVWDENAEGSNCGFFHPQYENLEGYDDNNNRLYMDDDGNTLVEKAIDYVLGERKKVVEKATNNQAIDRYIIELPITPSEAMLTLTGNIFPKKELQMQLVKLRTTKKLQNYKQVGDLIEHDGELHWHIKKHGDITHYPLTKNDDHRGSIVIWEHPMKDAPFGLYVCGIDSYDFDSSQTTSLGSMFVYKRFQGFEEYYDLLVAEYTGRPDTADEFYENCRKLARYYNASIMYENQNKGLFTYFTNKHYDYMLADQPDIINDIVSNSKVVRRKGIHVTQKIRDVMNGWIRDWLIEETSPGHKNLEKILSEPLLEELLGYNDNDNFDRVCALGCVMLYLKQIHNTTVKHNVEREKTRKLFDTPLFSSRWWSTSSSTSEKVSQFRLTG
jgi:hypothetical protein